MNQLTTLLNSEELSKKFEAFLREAANAKKNKILTTKLRQTKLTLLDEITSKGVLDYFSFPTLEHLINCIAIEPVIKETIIFSLQVLLKQNKRQEENTQAIQNNPLAPLFDKVLIQRGYIKHPINLYWNKAKIEKANVVIGFASPIKKEMEISIPLGLEAKEIPDALNYLLIKARNQNIPETCLLNEKQRELLDAKYQEIKTQTTYLFYNFKLKRSFKGFKIPQRQHRRHAN